MAEERQTEAQTRGHESDRPQRRPSRARRGRYRRRRICAFCVEHVEHIDYRDVDTLRRYITDQGQIQSRRKTGTCARHQRRLTVAIKRARHLALLPYTAEHARLSKS